MAEFPALPLFTDAYMADTEHLTDAEHGLYLKMLMVMWRSPDCRIPNDDAWLARRFRKTPEEVQSQLRPLISEFCASDGNWITQKRLRKEWQYVQRKSRKNRASAKARWEKENGECERNATIGNANAMPPHPHPHPHLKKEEDSPPVSPSPPEREGEGEAPRAPPLMLVGDEPKPRKRATRWQAGQEVPADWIEDGGAARRHHGLPEIDLHLEATKFVNHWLGESRAHGAKLDWHRTWINWVLNSRQKPTNGVINGDGTKLSPGTAIYAGFGEALRDREQRRALEGGARGDAAQPLLEGRYSSTGAARASG